MKVKRTKRLTLNRILKILQLRYGTQVESVIKSKNIYISDSICGQKREFTRDDILNIENEIYSAFGF